jgi:hypothetical protein
VRQAGEFTRETSDKVLTYKRGHDLKACVRDRDFTDHYLTPLQLRIREKMQDENYHRYLAEKHRLIQEMDVNPIPIRSPRPLPPLARIEVSAHGLRDPKDRFFDQQFAEEKLSRILNDANGITTPVKRTPGTKSLDYKQYSILYQTRFFFGADPEKSNRSGARVFEGTGASRVGKVLDSFDPPEK